MNPFRLLYRLPFNPKSAIRNSKLLIILLSLSPLLLGFPATVHAQWEPDRRLTFDDTSSATTYNNAWCVAATGDTVHVVWSHRRNGTEIYYRRSLDSGVSWGQEIRLTNAQGGSYSPSVAVSGSYVHLTWSDFRDGDVEIYYIRSTDGGSVWEPDQRLTNAGGLSEVPSLAASGSDVHVVWWDNRSGGDGVYYKRSTDSGVQWSPDTCLSQQVSTDTWASVSASGAMVHVVWDERPGVVYYKRSSDRGSSWSPTTQLSSQTAMAPSIASSESLVHVTWEGPSGSVYRIFYKRSTNGGVTWSQDTLLPSGAWSFLPSICVSGGVVHVVWWDSGEEIFYNHSTDAGISWQLFYTQLTNDTSHSEYSSVAASDSAVHVVWMDDRDGNWEVYYKRNPTGNLVRIEVPGVVQRLKLAGRVSVRPNPFISFATVPCHSSERFALYDISGRKVGVWKGDRIGEGLPAGVYFLRAGDVMVKPLRIVKLR